jgi:ABC-type transport system involved in cytochrome bd biosynthesis fused ATPase/permease subunit
VNKKTNPKDQYKDGEKLNRTPWNVPNQTQSYLKILIPVGTAIIIVAVVK